MDVKRRRDAYPHVDSQLGLENPWFDSSPRLTPPLLQTSPDASPKFNVMFMYGDEAPEGSYRRETGDPFLGLTTRSGLGTTKRQ